MTKRKTKLILEGVGGYRLNLSGKHRITKKNLKAFKRLGTMVEELMKTHPELFVEDKDED